MPGGGVALNCVANGKVLRDGAIDALWVQPEAGDAGGALGAALAAYHEFVDRPRQVGNALDGMQGAYLGPAFSDSEIADRLNKAGAVFQIVDDAAVIENTVALVEDKAIGWFQRRMGLGAPWAPIPPGTRSPRQLNLKVKFASFRRLCPRCFEDVAEWFDLDDDSPYMLVVATSRNGVALGGRKGSVRDRPAQHDPFGHPAVTHVDMSARIQRCQETNPRYHALLSAFKARTAVCAGQHQLQCP